MSKEQRATDPWESDRIDVKPTVSIETLSNVQRTHYLNVVPCLDDVDPIVKSEEAKVF